MSQSDKALWLVKSGGRILGPYSKAEINHLLVDKELVVLDEILLPNKRWNYIRDEASFADTVEKLRVQAIEAGEDPTTTVGVAVGTTTDGITEKIDRIYPDDLTDEISLERDIKDAEFQEINSLGQRRSRASQVYESYGYEGDKNLEKHANKTPWYLWALTSVILLGSIVYVYYQKSVRNPVIAKNQNISDFQRANHLIQLGRYDSAIELLKEINKSDPKNLKVSEPLGILLIQLENQTALGRRLLEDVLSSTGTKLPNVKVGLGIADLAEGEIESAKKIFRNVIEQDPLNTRAMLNLSIAEYMQKNYAEAMSQLQTLINLSAVPDEAHILFPVVAIRLWEKDKQNERLNQSLKLLEKLPNENAFYQEAQFFKVYLYSLIDQPEKAIASARKLLDLDPLGSDLFQKDLYIFSRAYNWSSFLPWCQGLTQKMESTAVLLSLQGYCLLRAGSKIDAKKKIDVAISQEPQNPVIQGVYAHILSEIGLIEQYIVALNSAVDFNSGDKYQLPILLKARLCEEQANWQCASRYWDQLIQKNTQSLPAIAGMINILIGDKEYQTAEEYLNRGIQLSSKYIPFLELKDELSLRIAEERAEEG